MRVQSIHSFLSLLCLTLCCAGSLQVVTNAATVPGIAPSPREVGKRIAEQLISIPPVNRDDYPSELNRYAALRFAKAVGDTTSIPVGIRDWYYEQRDAGWVPTIGNNSYLFSVDRNVFGTFGLEVYQFTRDPDDLSFALYYADQEWASPRTDGLSYYSRFWVDDMWMISSVQVAAYRATGNTVYLDRAALTLERYIHYLQVGDPGDGTPGLFWHSLGYESGLGAYPQDDPEPPAPYTTHWGRGNGWGAAAMADLLIELPDDHEHYQAIMDGYLEFP